MYRTEVQMQPPQAEAGQPVALGVTVLDAAGRAVSQLPESHGKPMHLVVISRDLGDFAHLHPSWDGDAFRVHHSFGAAGEYLLFVDYQEPGRGQVVDRHCVRVPGAVRPAPAPLEESPRTQRAGDLALAWRSDESLRAGEGAMLHFDVTDAATGAPVTDLEPYLGAMAHFLVLSADGRDFVHVHALDDASGSGVSAHAAFPRPGLYKLWAQVQRRGTVVTVPFVLRVGAALPRAEPLRDAAPGKPDAHAHHP